MLLYIGANLKVKKYPKKLFIKLESKLNFDFAKNTTYGCGGIAKIAYFPKNTLEVIVVFEIIKLNNYKYFVLGNGSNVLASDKFYNGAVICTKKFKGIYRTDKNKIYCSAGTQVSEILKYCKIHLLSGLEYLSKIPATIGGIAFMNGGISGNYVQNNVINVKVLNGKIDKFSTQKCNFRYKHSTMRDINCFILGVELSVLTNSEDNITNLINFYNDRRKHLPKGKSCGCVFKNPPNCSAGELIDKCNLKGCFIGNAVVSNSHANFIINYGKSSHDVYLLIKFVQNSVFKKFNVMLEEEVVYIGDDYL